MAKLPNIGDLTEAQTKQLAIECLGILPWDAQIEVLKEVFDADMRLEVAAQMEREE